MVWLEWPNKFQCRGISKPSYVLKYLWDQYVQLSQTHAIRWRLGVWILEHGHRFLSQFAWRQKGNKGRNLEFWQQVIGSMIMDEMAHTPATGGPRIQAGSSHWKGRWLGWNLVLQRGGVWDSPPTTWNGSLDRLMHWGLGPRSELKQQQDWPCWAVK